MKITISISEIGTMVVGTAEPTDTQQINRMGNFMLAIAERSARIAMEMEGIGYNEHRATVDKPPQQKE